MCYRHLSLSRATDIAFAMGVFGAFAGKFPAAVSAFLLTLATVDDLGAIVVIATCFAKKVQAGFLAAAAGVQVYSRLLATCLRLWYLFTWRLRCYAYRSCLKFLFFSELFTPLGPIFVLLLFCVMQGLMFYMQKQRVESGKSYFAAGLAMWLLLVQGGVNADIAGVCAGLSVWGGKGDTHNIHRLVKYWKPICGLAIMPLFALANCAVPIVGPAAAASAGAAAQAPVAWGIGAGLILGKPLGIMGITALAVKMGIATYPQGMVKAHLPIVGLLGGIGFTMYAANISPFQVHVPLFFHLCFSFPLLWLL